MKTSKLQSCISLLYLVISILLTLASCADEDNEPNQGGEEPPVSREKTIIAYLTADNNISSSLYADLKEMVKGSASLPENCNLVAFADFSGENPYIAHVKDSTIERVRTYDSDFYSTNRDTLASTLQWIIDKYPAKEYVLIFGGHGSGALIRQDSIPTPFKALKAYGYDNTGTPTATTTASTSTWLNTPSMASALASLRTSDGNPIRFSYIFFDCCCMQTVENAYALRTSADYILAPASETPASGADYTTMIPIMQYPAETAIPRLVNSYSDICFSAVATSQMEPLLYATLDAMRTIDYTDEKLTLNTTRCIYYYKGSETGLRNRQPALHDIKNVMSKNLTDANYLNWSKVLDQAIVSKNLSSEWMTGININFSDFEESLLTHSHGGMGMIVPSENYTLNRSDINTSMMQLEWCRKLWTEFGW